MDLGGREGGDGMLAQHPIDVMLTATDLGVAKQFYGEITRTSISSNEQTTKASWRVADVVADVAELRAHGVEVAEYDEPGLKTMDGVADIGFALSAWLFDPSGNTIGLLQFKDERLG
jgi:hypothetical protein